MDADDKALVLMIMYGKSVGGSEFQFIEAANFLANKYTVRLISLGGGCALSSSKIDPRIELQVYEYSGFIQTLIALIRAYFKNLHYPAKYVVSTTSIANFLGWSSSLMVRRRLIAMQTVSKKMFHSKLNNFVLKRFDAVIAGANDICAFLKSEGVPVDKIHIIHNWVDFTQRITSETRDDTRRRLGLNEQTVVGCIGRLHPQKGQIHLVRAFAKVAALYPGVVLLLVGDGSMRGELEDEVANLNLSKRVIFTGTIIGGDYNNYLAAIDIYVQPSIFEGLPRTLLDAMYMGKVIIATEINGNKEAITDDEHGLLVAAGDAEQLEAALLRLLNHPEDCVRLAKNAHINAVNNFSMEAKLLEIEVLVFAS